MKHKIIIFIMFILCISFTVALRNITFFDDFSGGFNATAFDIVSEAGSSDHGWVFTGGEAQCQDNSNEANAVLALALSDFYNNTFEHEWVLEYDVAGLNTYTYSIYGPYIINTLSSAGLGYKTRPTWSFYNTQYLARTDLFEWLDADTTHTFGYVAGGSLSGSFQKTKYQKYINDNESWNIVHWFDGTLRRNLTFYYNWSTDSTDFPTDNQSLAKYVGVFCRTSGIANHLFKMDNFNLTIFDVPDASGVTGANISIMSILLTSPDPDQNITNLLITGNTTDTTPTFSLITLNNANCSINTTTICSTTGTTAHICTQPAGSAFPIGISNVTFNCSNSVGNTSIATRELNVTTTPKSINLSFGPTGITVFRFENCSPDYETENATPQGQNSSHGIDYVCNNGNGGTGDIQIKLSGALNTNWSWSASNTSINSGLITLTTSYQTIYSGLGQDSCVYFWHKANCSYITQNPGAYEQYQII